MTQTKFFRWTLLLCLSGATSPLAAQGVGEKAKKVEQMQVLKTDGKVLRITVDGKEQQIPLIPLFVPMYLRHRERKLYSEAR